MRFLMRALILIMFVSLNLAAFAQQTGEDKAGNWLMYFGTTKLSDRFSLHSELQVRLYEPFSNFNQLLPRIGLNYHFSPDAMGTAGYAYIQTESFEKGALETTASEHRLWEQFVLRNRVNRVLFEHRYRLEQRWITANDVSRYADRARYRLMVTIPLSNRELVPRTFFAALYDEIFLNISDSPFDQNRLYLALGYKASQSISVQTGYLRHRLGALNFDRLQFAVFWNTDLSKNNAE